MNNILTRISQKSFNCCFKIFKNHASVCTQIPSFDSEEEVVENFLDKLMLIGINLPDKKNILTESAIDKLSLSIQKFNAEKDFTVAILHGCGGYFCMGIEPNENALKKGDELIKVLDKLKKPIVGSLQGSIKNFGIELAIMCDLKAMDETALIGFGDRNDRRNVPAEVFKRLVSAVGISRAFEITLMNCTWKADEAKAAGLVNRSVKCGSDVLPAVTPAGIISGKTNQTLV